MGGQNLNFGQQPGGLSVDPSTMKNFRCPNCNNQVFQPLFIAKKVSALQSPQGKDGLAPLQIFACTNCGAVPKEFGGTLLEQDETVAPPEPEGNTEGTDE